MSKKIIFSAGRTGGHIFPAVNLMEHFLNKGYEVLLVTDTRGDNFIKKNLKLFLQLLNYQLMKIPHNLEMVASYQL